MTAFENSDCTHPTLSAAEISRGIGRILDRMGYATLLEFKLGNQRRVDVAGVDRKGAIAFVEIKSSVSDFRSDAKWPLYLDYCDFFYFGVGPGFPLSLLDEPASLPERTGIIIADRFGGDVVRNAPEALINAARRKSQTLQFARRAAERLQRRIDNRQAVRV